jgi:hypothetical protein
MQNVSQNYCIHEIITELNTHFNGSKTEREKSLVQIIRKLALAQENVKCENNANQKPKLREHNKTFHDECEQCEHNSIEEKDLGKHEETTHEEILMVHHVEEKDDDEFEMNPAIWNILLSENDESALTQEEEKEISKLHRYFAHRSGQKLWENLFHPAGNYKGK